jgi:hypothetical protein
MHPSRSMAATPVAAALILAILAALTPATAAAILPPPGRAATGARAPRHLVRMCRQYQFATEPTTAYRSLAIIRNDWWGQPGCITTNTAARDNFTVTTSYNWTGVVRAYPETLRGCWYGRCTPHSGFPVKVSRAGRPAVLWHTRGPNAAGSYNAALDLWFGKTRNTSRHADGAEVLVWPYRHGLCCSLHGATEVRLGGRLWWVEHWRTCQHATCWNYVQFRAVRPVNGWRWLRLAPLLAYTVRARLVSRAWWWWSANAGFEIWSGGRGLASTAFWARS